MGCVTENGEALTRYIRSAILARTIKVIKETRNGKRADDRCTKKNAVFPPDRCIVLSWSGLRSTRPNNLGNVSAYVLVVS